MSVKDIDYASAIEHSRFEYFILVAIVISYTFILTVLSLLRYLNFYTTNWDFGIARQLLWTGSHGFLLFETGDYASTGVLSFLQVHSTYIAIPIAYIYSIFPTASFLIVLQSLIVALSVVPFFLLVREVISDGREVYFILSIYLFSFTLLSAFFYDFHWELFLPLEYLSMFYLINRQRYFLSLVPLLFGTLTLEVFPFLSAGMLVYFAYRKFGSKFWNPLVVGRNREWLSIVSILVITVALYALVRILQYYVVPAFLDSSHISNLNLASTGFVPRGLSGATLLTSINYWVFIYLAFGFVPFFHKKHLILALPWLIGSIIIVPNYSSTFGNQYSAIAFPILSIGFIYGVSALKEQSRDLTFTIVIASELFFLSFGLLVLDYSRFFLNPSPPTGLIGLMIVALSFFAIMTFFTISSKHWQFKKFFKILRGGNTNTSRAILILLSSLLIFNIVIGPLNPQNFEAAPGPGYQVAFTVNPEFQYALIMSKEIPNNATIIASDNLFPMVANNPNAYSLLWFPFNETFLPYFPFDSNHLPKYVFIDSSQKLLVPNFIMNEITNQTNYGLVSRTFHAGYPGNIYLYELHYHKPATYYSVP